MLASSAQPFAYPVPRMAKTFDNISEASATNYLFLFAQRTLALQNEPPTPPPLNALGLPCKAMCLLWDLLRKNFKTPGPDGTASEAAAAPYGRRVLPDKAGELVETVAAAGEKEDNAQFSAGSVSSAAAVDDQDAVAAEASPSSPPPSPSSEEVASGEKTPLIKETFTDKIAPLAREITTYILDHQDDAAQEDRWRTTMKREMGKSFREQREEVQKVKEEVKETLQLVKNIAELIKPH